MVEEEISFLDKCIFRLKVGCIYSIFEIGHERQITKRPLNFVNLSFWPLKGCIM